MEGNETSRRNLLFFSLLAIITATSLLRLSAAATSANNDDAAVMAKLAKSLIPTPSGWSAADPCDWTGVSCDSSGHITSINLASKSLSGHLPSELNQLSHLTSFSLQRNHLSGSFPSLSGLTSLQRLNLDSNNFTSVPSLFLSGLTSLQILDIGQNPNLPPWTLPETLSDSTTLNSIDAGESNLVGTLPDIFESFPNLQSIRLSYNNLTGPLPNSFAKSGIQHLWLNNQALGLSGKIDVLGSMSELTQVWLHQNQFSGPIPDLSKCTSLFDLSLRNNQLTGPVSPSLTTLPNLANVSLQNNKLQGPSPSFPKAVHVSLGTTNNFCSSSPGPCDPQVTTLLEIAGALGYPMALAESWSGNNPCDGWKSVSCDSKGSVTVLNFGKQGWVGTISPSIANLTVLTTLLLNDNNLTGTIPPSLANLSQLKLLDISNNNVSGQLPEFGSGVTLKTSGNPFIGVDVPLEDGSSSSSGSLGGTATAMPNNSSLSPWVILAIIFAAVFVIAAFAFVTYKYIMKKRSGKYKLFIKGSVKGTRKYIKGADDAGNGYGGFGSELPSQSCGDNSDIQVYDGGSVAIPMEVLREATDNFSEDNILGQGGFGIVYKGQLHNGTQIAVKRMEVTVASSQGVSEFQAEIAVLSKVRHKHLVGLHGFCVNGNERLLVYEYMAQGTLAQHLFGYREMGVSPLTWKQRVTIVLDVARGVEYLHSLAQQSFIHRDLKPCNVLLGDDMRAKVADFGLVKNAPDGKHSMQTRLAGTFGYLAPEYAATGKVTTKVDVFAFGVILLETITGRKALDENLPDEQCHLVTWFRKLLNSKDNIRKYLDPSLNPDEETFINICKVAELAGHCTAREPFQRPDMGHVVSVLSPLIDEWKPTTHDEEDSFSIDLDMSLPQALQRWQASDGGYTSTSLSKGASTFASSCNSRDAR